jgi:hypothetical protein
MKTSKQFSKQFSKQHLLPALCTFWFVTAGCKSESAPVEPTRNPPTLTTESVGEVMPGNHSPVDAPPSRIRSRRLSAEQWRRAYPVVLGNDSAGRPIAWPNLETAMFKDALGEPDYLTTTEEALEPNVVYAKYANDAAHHGCRLALDADLTRSGMARVIARYASFEDTVASNPAAIDANLVYLKKRFHGVTAAKGDPTRILPLQKLFTDGAASSRETTTAKKNKDGWMLVCIGLLTSPEFNAY